jgi:hypothetical protein
MKKRNIAKIALISLLGLATLDYAAKKIALNVMSHAGRYLYSEVFTDPKTYFTLGRYKGFKGAPNTEIDLNAIYVGLQKNSLPKSEYKPTSLTGVRDTDFFSIKQFIKNPELLVAGSPWISKEGTDKILSMKKGEIISFSDVINRYGGTPYLGDITDLDLGDFTVSVGRDERGIYTSIYDKWDFSSNAGFFERNSNRIFQTRIASRVLPRLGNPINFYDRFYWKDYTNSAVDIGGKIK